MKLANLSCNYLVNPLGVETTSPLLGWRQEDSRRGAMQQAYRLLASSSAALLEKNQGDLWDSGTVESDASQHIYYKGIALKSCQPVFWKVCVTNNAGASEWSAPAYWEMGILAEAEWKARWISDSLYGWNENPPPAPMFRKGFKAGGQIERARMYVCGLGYHDVYINGKRIGDEVLAPAASQFDLRDYYHTYDITAALQEGDNAVGVILGYGLYKQFAPDAWDFNKVPWRSHLKLLCEMHITYKDGREEVVASDESWRRASSPITYNELRNGEHYDARKEIPGWNQPDFDDSAWEASQIVTAPGGRICSMQMTPIKVTGTIKPKKITEVKPGVFVYDLGQNFSGWAKLIATGPEGATVTLRFAEKVFKDGALDNGNIKTLVFAGDFQTDRYTFKGKGVEAWEPRFTYHGFQYVEMTGFPGVPTLDNLEGVVVHTDFESRGSFECANDTLNAIQKATRWSDLTNYHGFPTDCPHREKNGWMGDAHLSAEQLLLNFGAMTAYRKWLRDIYDNQRHSGQLPCIVPNSTWGYNWGSGPAWDSAALIIPWMLYTYCGDTDVLAEHYAGMARYVDFAMGMRRGDGTISFGLGDWCPVDRKRICPPNITDTAYIHVDASIVSKAAKLLGKGEDAKRYAGIASSLRETFRKAFVKPGTIDVMENTQTQVACAIYQGMLEEGEIGKAMEHLAAAIKKYDYHVDVGILGAKYMMHALAEHGRNDLAYRVATQTDFPSWGHWIAQGATTLWEDWQGGSSRNHHMFGDISAWFYKALVGINPDESAPGFKHSIIHPRLVDGLDWAKGWHDSLYGRISVEWERKGGYSLKVAIPANASATVFLPAGDLSKAKLDGQQLAKAEGVLETGVCKGEVFVRVGAGEYRFQVAGV